MEKDSRDYEYSGDVDDLIEIVLTQLNQADDRKLEMLRRLTVKCLAMSAQILGKGAFRRELKESKPINMNIFETTLYLMALLSDSRHTGDEEKIQEGLYNVIISSEFLDYIGNSRDYTAKVYGRFGLMDDLFEEVCHG